MAATSRIYRDSPEAVVAASERVLKLADGDDFTFAHQRDGFSAQRRWTFFALITVVFGTDYWSVKATPQGELTLVEVQVGELAQAVTATGTSAPGTWAATTLPAGAAQVTAPALYELFFARLDYLLGRRTEWPSCTWHNSQLEQKVTWGSNMQLCNSQNVKDETPSAPMERSQATHRP